MKKSTNEAIKWLNANAKKNPQWVNVDEEGEPFIFDYPDYAGLPKKLAKKLTSDAVDAIQSSWPDVGMKWNGKEFRYNVLSHEGYDL